MKSEPTVSPRRSNGTADEPLIKFLTAEIENQRRMLSIYGNNAEVSLHLILRTHQLIEQVSAVKAYVEANPLKP